MNTSDGDIVRAFQTYVLPKLGDSLNCFFLIWFLVFESGLEEFRCQCLLDTFQ